MPVDLSDEAGAEIQRSLQQALQHMLTTTARNCYRTLCEKRGKENPAEDENSPFHDPENKLGEIVYTEFPDIEARDTAFSVLKELKDEDEKPLIPHLAAIATEKGTPAIAHRADQSQFIARKLGDYLKGLNPEVGKSREEVDLGSNWRVEKSYFEEYYQNYVNAATKRGCTIASRFGFANALGEALDKSQPEARLDRATVNVEVLREGDLVRPKPPRLASLESEVTKAAERINSSLEKGTISRTKGLDKDAQIIGNKELVL